MQSRTNNWYSNILLIIFIVLAGISQVSSNTTYDDAHSSLANDDGAQLNLFPNLFKFLRGKDRYKFQYEINSLDNYSRRNESVLSSILVEESFSFSLNSGRIIVDYGDAHRKGTSQFSIFYWFRTESNQINYWMRPFICSAAPSKLDEKPFTCGALSDVFPADMANLCSYTEPGWPGYNIQGLGGIWANVAKLIRDNEPNTQIEHSTTSEGNGENGDNWDKRGDRWLVRTKNNRLLEFYFLKSVQGGGGTRHDDDHDDDNKSLIEDLIGLEIRFSHPPIEGQEQPDRDIVDVLTLLKVDWDNVPNDTFYLPEGYSCHQNINPSVPMSNSSLISGSRMKYKFEINVITNGDQSNDSVSYIDYSSMPPKPVDSLRIPKINSSQIVFLHDQFDKFISIISHLREVGFNLASRQSLTVWDFNTKRKHVVHGQTGACDEPKGFMSNLFSVDANHAAGGGGGDTSGPSSSSSSSSTSTGHVGANDVLVEIQLSEKLSLILDKDSLKLLTFTLQNRKNYNQLIDLKEISGSPFDYELTYEMPIRKQISIVQYDNAKTSFSKLLEYPEVKLLTKYTYAIATDTWTPISTSLLFFDKEITKLMLQIDFNLLHLENYEPWQSSKHLLSDLSKCKLGYKQSAKLEIHYPLSQGDKIELDQIEKPHQFFREAIAQYLNSVYMITLIRLPKIEVFILDDHIKIVTHLLDQSHILIDSQLLPLTVNVKKDKYIKWLRQATKSVLLGDLKTCAEYCQEYKCEVYAYCKHSLSCYIYNDETELDLITGYNFGTMQDLYLNCEAYRVQAIRQQRNNSDNEINELSAAAYKWRQNSWSLSEILESLVNSFSVPNRKYSSIHYEDYSMTTTTTTTTIDNNNQRQQTGDPIEDSMDLYKSSVMKPMIELLPTLNTIGKRILKRTRTPTRLWPILARYEYDNLQVISNSLFVGESNPFLINQEDRLINERQLDGRLINFQVYLSGYKFRERTNVTIHSNLAKAHQIDLEDGDGYLILDQEHDIEDCVSICANDISCSSFSYCSLATSCILTRLNQTAIDCLWTRSLNGGHYLPPVKPNQVVGGGGGGGGGAFEKLSVQEDLDCTIMKRTYSDQFERLEVKMLSSYKSHPLQDVLSVFEAPTSEDCALICARDQTRKLENKLVGFHNQHPNSPNCLSYDFCQPIEGAGSRVVDHRYFPNCVLFSHHLVSKSDHINQIKGDHPNLLKPPQAKLEEAAGNKDNNYEEKDLYSILVEQIGQHSFCTHYTRNFLADFHKINHRKLPILMKSGLVMKNYSPPQLNDNEKSSSADNDDAVAASQEIHKQLVKIGGDEENISLAYCARLCEEEPDCGSFEFCIANYKLAPGGLYLSCSLGNNETLELAPTGNLNRQSKGGKKNKKEEHYVKDMLQLERSQICSVYMYKSLSLILGHKKKNLVQLSKEIFNHSEAQLISLVDQDTSSSVWSKLLRLDLIVLFVFFLFGFMVRDLRKVSINQLGFQRLQETLDNARESLVHATTRGSHHHQHQSTSTMSATTITTMLNSNNNNIGAKETGEPGANDILLEPINSKVVAHDLHAATTLSSGSGSESISSSTVVGIDKPLVE